MCKGFRNIITSKTNRIVAVIVSLTMFAVMLLSASYILAEANHDCTGDHCPVCACIQQCENNIRQLGSGTFFQTIPILFIALFLLPLLLIIADFSQTTLVTQKVRLNN